MTQKLSFLAILISILVSCLPNVVLAADIANGAKVFKACALCHSVELGKRGSVGPNLFGVVGRAAGQEAFGYSPSVKNANFSWTPDRLDAFLKQPAAYLRGTRMSFPGLASEADRADVIAFLATKK